MSLKKYAKDTAVTAGISFVISFITNLFSGNASSDQKIEQDIKDNEVVNIVNEEVAEPSEAPIWPFVVIAFLIIIVICLTYMLCRKNSKILPQNVNTKKEKFKEIEEEQV